jgi:hypothetical protein
VRSAAGALSGQTGALQSAVDAFLSDLKAALTGAG